MPAALAANKFRDNGAGRCGFQKLFPVFLEGLQARDADGVVHVMAVLEDGELECVNGVEAEQENVQVTSPGEALVRLGALRAGAGS